MISSHSGYDRGVRLCRFLSDNVSLLSIQKDCSVKVWCDYDVMCCNCDVIVYKLWDTNTGEDIRSYRFSGHDYSDEVILYISLSPKDNWLAASTSNGMTIVSTLNVVYIASIIQHW